MIVTPFDHLGGTPSTTGTWTHTGSGPAAPAAYNDSIDFTGFPDGDYTYTYSVTLSSCDSEADVVIAVGTQTPVLNDTCAGARVLIFPVTPGGSEFYPGETNLGSCPGIADPTDSGIALPSAWGAGPHSGDLWYKITISASSSVSVKFNGGLYGVNGVTNPMLAIYSGTCGAPVLVDATTSAPNGKTVVISEINSTGSPIVRYLRFVTLAGGEGLFDITVVNTT